MPLSSQGPATQSSEVTLAEPKAGTAVTEPAQGSEAHVNPRRPMRQGRREHRMDRQDRQPRERVPGKRFEARDKRPDPNSPFAKLAALKAQLEADAKERR